ncbi:hypothetical protein BDV25DRAFT_135789 [Aspergillus avenaceus]|uniref:AMP-dependent synthetase/ligase domain-containing protein n=1 Tax=Aspergillus avenaceus TaxID=36643 RepID=A0A5N6U921_ASPAV|nr:hypothetical protein BDV25DRAFT_135789 [Aspergillus avenaceus]
MARQRYSLLEILAVAELHPFYHPDEKYPPDAVAIQAACERACSRVQADLRTQPVLHKCTLYKVIERLTQDMSLDNVYRKGSYVSATGGGSGGFPMIFAVDALENRQQRMRMGELIRLCGITSPADWVLSLHMSGDLYRSLDLTTETLENSGATVLSAGSNMALQDVVDVLGHYHVNALTGDPNQIVQLVHYISTLPSHVQQRLRLEKIIYTSESLTGPQRAFILTILGDVKIFSFMGSAEAGPWAVSHPDLLGDGIIPESNTVDFVFDIRSMIIEILPLTASETENCSSGPDPLPLGEPGLIVQTSLQRLRNPLVRYISGDIGSLHPLSPSALALIPETDRDYLRVIRMHGRDRRFSFEWFGAYYEFETMKAFMLTEQFGILQWQVILDQLPSSTEATLEVRLLRASPRAGILSDEALIRRLWAFFIVLPRDKHLFQVIFAKDLNGFERSATGAKVIHFVDRLH